MATEVKIETTKTYATRANAIKAVEKIYGSNNTLRFFIMPMDDGRFAPIFLGEKAVTAGVHFNFTVVG